MIKLIIQLMVKSIEQQIVFLNRDLLPLYGITSTDDTNSVINTELLGYQNGFLDKVNKLLPFVTLFYPIKKFNLHKTNHTVQTLRQAFSLLVHCLEISQIPHTIWTKKHSRKNIQFLRLNTENYIHKTTTNLHIINKMTQAQKSTQQLYDAKIDSIDEDVDSQYAYPFIGEPQVTRFKSIYRRTTNYRKFPMELNRVNGLFTIDHNDYVNINVIHNLILVFKVDNYCPFDEAFSSINHISVKIGGTTLFETDGRSLLSILKIYPHIYNKSLEAYKSGKLIIPIQYILMMDEALVLCRFGEDFTINCISIYKVDCFCHGFKLTKSEYARFNHSNQDTLIWQYLTIEKNNCDEIILDYPICMSELIVKTNDHNDYKIQLNGITLLNNQHPLIEYNKNQIMEDNTYYYLSQLELTDYTSLYEPFGGFILGKEFTKLTISPRCNQLCLMIRFKSQLLSTDLKAYLGHTLVKETKL